jgi:hypothetical protein
MSFRETLIKSKKTLQDLAGKRDNIPERKTLLE